MLVDDVPASDVTTVTPRRNFKELLFRKFQGENPSMDKFPSIEVFMQHLLQLYNQRLTVADEAANFGMLGGDFPEAISPEDIEERLVIPQKQNSHNSNKNRPPKRTVDTLSVVIPHDDQPCNGCGWINTCLDYAKCRFNAHCPT